jgi:putative FmdB family regulatory protein
MPIYEYRCQSCGHEIEVLQKISDTPLIHCQKCGKNSLEKLISATQFQLKGTGWYVTDFKKDSKAAKEKSTVSNEGANETKTDTTSDKKPPSSDQE